MAAATDSASHAAELHPGSNRNFGVVFAVVFAIVGLLPLWNGHAPRWWAIIAATAFAGVAIAKPDILRPLNQLWFRFGLLLSRIVSPLVMGAVFFLCVTPIALVMRLIGKDVLMLHRQSGASSYWIARDPPGPAPDTMKNQF